ncbi:SIR2 family NAD-dependent protein deacylase [Corallococcus sp. bb12-1]|uniref:SIR2 family NAD-dependent protein deacylase n=1 Tax=Corallococcus sp. bb12-1 TaxID=2996784 RepID=UPI003B63D227
MSGPSGFESLLSLARGPAARATLVVTGAGVSLASGIPTFRGTDPGAVWANEVLEKGTRAFFQKASHESWWMYLQRFEWARAARPNAAHLALADWERWLEARGREFTLVTQNVDTLHEQAGSRALIKVHGSLEQARCTNRGCRHSPPRGTLPLSSVDSGRSTRVPVRRPCPAVPAVAAGFGPTSSGSTRSTQSTRDSGGVVSPFGAGVEGDAHGMSPTDRFLLFLDLDETSPKQVPSAGAGCILALKSQVHYPLNFDL